VSNFGSKCEDALGDLVQGARCIDLHGVETVGRVGLWMVGRELRGLCLESKEDVRVGDALGLEPECVIRWTGTELVVDRGGDSVIDALSRPGLLIEPALARTLLDSIRDQNNEDCHSRLGKGILQGLKRQFPEQASYLFELLQNAADEGATRVALRMDEAAERLVFEHNGNPLSVADVLGLSLIGQSGKRGRTIGFMGIGFKAVYKRFERVEVVDDLWRFGFAKGGTGDRWKVLPMWTPDADGPTAGFSCRFNLAAPRGGLDAVRSDLQNVPPEAAVLLGRHALRDDDLDSWRLSLPDQRVEVRRLEHGKVDRMEWRSGDDTREWVFVSHVVEVGEEAVDEYRDQRDDEAADPGPQVVELFYEAASDGSPLAEEETGFFHAVLPTEAETGHRFQLQANWLLSGDRGRLNAFKSSPWNRDLAAALPHLLVRLLSWASSSAGPEDPLQIYNLLPTPQGGEPVCARLGGHSVDLQPLERAFVEQKLVPVRSEPRRKRPGKAPSRREAARLGVEWVRPESDREQIRFRTASSAVYFPPAVEEHLAAHIASAWLGGAPIPTKRLSEGARALLVRLPAIGRFGPDLIASSAGRLADLFRFGSRSGESIAWALLDFLDTVHQAMENGEALPKSAALLPLEGGEVGSERSAKRLDGRWFSLPATFAAEVWDLIDEADRSRLVAMPLQRLVRSPPELDEDDEKERDWFGVLERMSKRLRTLDTVGMEGLATRWFETHGDGALPKRARGRVLEWTDWARREQEAALVPRVLVGDRLVGRKKATLGAAYGHEDVELVGGDTFAYVSSAYLGVAGSTAAWSKFLGRDSARKITLSWSRLSVFTSGQRTAFHRRTGRPFPELRVTWDFASTKAGTIYHSQVAVEGQTLAEPWRTCLLESTGWEEKRRHALTRLAAQLRPASATEEISYIAFRDSGTTTRQLDRAAPWVVQLRSVAWIPLQGGGFARPEEVLLEADPTRPEAPLAEVDSKTLRGLKRLSDSLGFGRLIAGGEPLEQLEAAIRLQRGPETFVRVWEAIIEPKHLATFRREEGGLARLKQIFGAAPCVPVRMSSRKDAKLELVEWRRITGGRVTLGGRLVPTSRIAVEQPSRVAGLLKVASSPTPDQAVSALLWASQEPTPVRAKDVATRSLLALNDQRTGLVVEPWRRRLRALVAGGRIRLPARTRTGEPIWAPLYGDGPVVLLADDPLKERLLRYTDRWVPANLALREFPAKVLKNLASVLGSHCLSSEGFILGLSVDEQAPLEVDHAVRIAKVLAAMSGERADLQIPEIYRAEGLLRYCEFPDGEELEEPARAGWDGDGIYVEGEALDYFRELKAEVLAARDRLDDQRAAALCDLFVYVEDSERFGRELREVCASQGLDLDRIEATALRFRGTLEATGASADSRLIEERGESTAETPTKIAAGDPVTPAAEVEVPGTPGPSVGILTSEGPQAARVDPAAQGSSPPRPPSPRPRTIRANRTPDGGRPPGRRDGTTSGGDSGSRGQPALAPQRAVARAPFRPPPAGGSGTAKPSRPPSERTRSAGRDWFKAGLGPKGEGRGSQARGEARSDEASRAIAERYERVHHREPQPAADNQEGFDLDSLDPATGIRRRIEVKGTIHEWASDATVTVKRRQFQEALLHLGDQKVEYWLYIVDRESTDPRLRAFRDFAAKVKEVYVAATDWDVLADDVWSPPRSEEDVQSDGRAKPPDGES